MRGIGGSTLRGGQTVFHGIRMWGQLFRAAVLFAAFTTVAVPAWTLWHRTNGAEWYAAGMVTLAEAKLVLGYDPDSGQEIRFEDGTRRVLRIREIAASVPARQARERIKTEMFASAGLGLTAGGGLIALFLVVFWYRGAQLGRQKRIRGAEMVTAAELRRRLQSPHERLLGAFPGGRGFRPYSIAGIPYPERTETQHTIVSGTTGSGKTVLISDLVAQIRARGERCVLYDKMGSYTRAFFDADRDVLMNPLDARAPRWSPFLEARNPRDFDMMAAALIPQQKDTVDPFWVTAARQLFSNGAGVLRQKGVKDNRVLVDHLLKTDLTALAEAMEGTVAQSIVDPDNPKTALSVRAMLTANLAAFEFLPDEGAPFSIREWVSDEDRQGFLFLTSRGDQHASLRGLISTWLEIAVNAMLSLAQEPDRRIWVILDELPTLHQVPSLQPGLAESRQFGGCFVLGVQVASALRDLYGRNGAETISGLCGTRVVLAAPDRDTAQWSADSLGRSEIEEVSEGFSYGANTIRDGVSLTPRRELRALALPSEIMRLENLSGYLKFPGPFPVASIRLKYVARPKAAERFVPRDGDGTDRRGGANDAGIAASAHVAEAGDDEDVAIPPLPGEAGTGPDEPPPAPEDIPDTAPLQGALDLVPLPGEAGEEESGPEPAATAGGGMKDGRRKAATAAAPAPKANGEAPAGNPETVAPETPDPTPAADGEPAEPEGAEPREWF
ncbi:MAG: type IV secretion system DNA-binding domain-containing protein [Rhodospirillales bacterium]|nr:type IV secretion system DNA-binding domain-containing protein [Rhodospirillales bacterium]